MPINCQDCKDPINLQGAGNPTYAAPATFEPLEAICSECAVSLDFVVDNEGPIPKAIHEGKVWIKFLGAWIHSSNAESAHIYKP